MNARTVKRILRQGALFLVLVVLAGVARLSLGSYDDLVKDSLTAQLRKTGMVAQMQGASFRLPVRLFVTGLGMNVPTKFLPIPVFVDSLQVAPHYFSLFLLKAGLNAELNIYQGLLVLDYFHSLFSGTGDLALRAQRIVLERHPIMSALQIRGLLDLQLSSTLRQVQASHRNELIITGGDLSLELSKGNYGGGHKWKGLVTLPPATDISLRLALSFLDGALSIQSAQAFSSWGSATAAGRLTVEDNGAWEDGKIKINLKLTGPAADTFAPYLALSANMPIESPPRDWQITIMFKKGQRNPEISLVPQE